jgi:hypothetical protein
MKPVQKIKLENEGRLFWLSIYAKVFDMIGLVIDDKKFQKNDHG